MEKVERAKSADTKPALVVKVPTPEETAKAAILIPTVAHITTKAELKSLYNENASILEVRVDGVTLLDAINKRLVQL
jgi:hypothetical protein